MTVDVQAQGINMPPSSIALLNDPFCGDNGGSSTKDVQSDFGSSGEAHAIKIRKPYTITKQRERWTEEEHNKFLEALKLHGRAWRQIEEHIGTKTAVQIRSHAQKFFSKVVRETGNSSEVKAIEIPPPRPKRKPAHPYPRKSVNLSNKGYPISEQLESLSPTKGASVSELENRSPASVLSAVGSDFFSSSLSNTPNSCTSPVSSAAGSKHGVLADELENGGQSSTISIEEEARSPSSHPEIAAGPTKDQSAMELDFGLEGHHDPVKVMSTAEPRVCSLKLFGRTVMVTDSHRSSSSSTGSTAQSGRSVITGESHQPNEGSVQESPPETPLKKSMQEDSSRAPENNSQSPWPVGMPPMLCYFAFQGDVMNQTKAEIVPVPWWPFYGNPPCSFTHPPHLSSKQDSPHACTEAVDERLQRDYSWAGSFTSSVCEIRAGEKNNDAVDSEALQFSLVEQKSFHMVRTDSSARGFIPYKRPADESQVDREVQCQRVRLSL